MQIFVLHFFVANGISAYKCPKGFTDLRENEDDQEFKHGSCAKGLTWEDARDYCARVYEGHLAVPVDYYENKALSQLASKNKDGSFKLLWLGLTDAEREGYWMNVFGKQAEFTNWGRTLEGTYNPDNARKDIKIDGVRVEITQNCVNTNFRWSQLWDDNFCNRKFKAVCQVHRCPASGCKYEDGECRPGWTDLAPDTDDIEDGYCLTLIDKMPWDNARITCDNLDAHLVRIPNRTINNLVTNFVNADYPKEEYRDEIKIPLVWLSYKKQQLLGVWPETYDWVNFRRVAVEFLPWGIGWYGQQLPDDEIKRHPSLQGETEYQDCAALMADQGKWDDEWCSSHLRAVCQQNKCYTAESCQPIDVLPWRTPPPTDPPTVFTGKPTSPTGVKSSTGVVSSSTEESTVNPKVTDPVINPPKETTDDRGTPAFTPDCCSQKTLFVSTSVLICFIIFF